MSITKHKPEEPRRDALKIIGAIGSTCIFPFQADELYGQHEHAAAHDERPAAAPAKPLFFKPAELATLAAFVDLIIPATDTPSASQAGVPAYIDYVASKNAKLGATLREGIRLLTQKKFAKLKPKAQEDLAAEWCDAAEKAKSKGPREAFWIAVKNLTADGYYTSKPGMRDELGYKGNQVLEAFPNCDAVAEH